MYLQYLIKILYNQGAQCQNKYRLRIPQDEMCGFRYYALSEVMPLNCLPQNKDVCWTAKQSSFQRCRCLKPAGLEVVWMFNIRSCWFLSQEQMFLIRSWFVSYHPMWKTSSSILTVLLLYLFSRNLFSKIGERINFLEMVQNVCISLSHCSAGLHFEMNCYFDVERDLPVSCRSTTEALLLRDFHISERM